MPKIGLRVCESYGLNFESLAIWRRAVKERDDSLVVLVCKRKMANKAITNARKTARGLIDDRNYPLPPRGEVSPGDLNQQMREEMADPWAQFPDADEGSVGSVSDPWDAFPIAPAEGSRR